MERRILAAAATLLAAAWLAGCDSSQRDRLAGDVKDTAQVIGQAARDAGDRLGQVSRQAGHDAAQAARDAGDKASDRSAQADRPADRASDSARIDASAQPAAGRDDAGASGDEARQARAGAREASGDAADKARQVGGEVAAKARQAGGAARQALDDTAITAKAKTALMADKDVKSSDIEVETFQGKVTLTGKVPDPAQVRRAESVVSSLQGVRGVENKLRAD